MQNEQNQQKQQNMQKEKLYTIRQVEKRLSEKVSSVWLRRVITEDNEWFKNKRKVRVKNRMIWFVTESDVLNYEKYLDEKEQLRVDRAEGRVSKYSYKRPTKYTYDKMKKTILEDTVLTKDEKKFMFTTLKRFNEKWEKEYIERMKKRNKKYNK